MLCMTKLKRHISHYTVLYVDPRVGSVLYEEINETAVVEYTPGGL